MVYSLFGGRRGGDRGNPNLKKTINTYHPISLEEETSRFRRWVVGEPYEYQSITDFMMGSFVMFKDTMYRIKTHHHRPNTLFTITPLSRDDDTGVVVVEITG